MKKYMKIFKDSYVNRDPRKYTWGTNVYNINTRKADTNTIVDLRLAKLEDPNVQDSLSLEDLMISKNTGKMKGIASISSDPLTNNFCKKMSKIKGTVCSQCYSISNLSGGRRSSLPPRRANDVLLARKLYELDEFIEMDNIYRYLRINADGEFHNDIHYKNVFRMAVKFYQTDSVVRCITIFTKRKDLVKKFGKFELDKYGVPEDYVQLIYSEPQLNTDSLKIPSGFDKVFGVYSAEYIKENKIRINCKKLCKTCGLCYKPGREIIREKLKNSSKPEEEGA